MVAFLVLGDKMGGLPGKAGSSGGEGLNQVHADFESSSQEVASTVTDIKVIGRRGNKLEGA
jgi:hypothetical protein